MCSCKIGCNSGRCQNALFCTEMCLCFNCENLEEMILMTILKMKMTYKDSYFEQCVLF